MQHTQSTEAGSTDKETNQTYIKWELKVKDSMEDKINKHPRTARNSMQHNVATNKGLTNASTHK